jgi:hypothetical protein
MIRGHAEVMLAENLRRKQATASRYNVKSDA